MNTTIKAVLLAGLLTLSACASQKEMPQDGTGSDALRPSPCVGVPGAPCAPVNYDGRGYTWLG